VLGAVANQPAKITSFSAFPHSSLHYVIFSRKSELLEVWPDAFPNRYVLVPVKSQVGVHV
jgi:hypothetical protein